MGFEISEELLAKAIDRLLAATLSPEEIERRIDARIEQRVGTLTLEQIAARWEFDLGVTRKKLRKWRVPMCELSTKLPRWRVATIEQLEKDREIPVKVRTVSRGKFSLEIQPIKKAA